MNRQILRLAVPNIISNITIPLVGLVDLAILGHLESEIYIGAIATGGVIFNFIYAVFSFLRMGTSGFTAQAYGENNHSEMILMFGRALLFAITGGLILIILQVPIEIFSFYLIDGSEAVKEFAKEYFRIRIFAAPASLGILALSGWYTGMQNARFPMYIAITINIINVGANLFFVFVLGLKSDGVAYGTVIAMYSGLFLGLMLFRYKYKKLLTSWNKKDFFNWHRLNRFFKVNRDIIIRTLCLTFTFAFFTSQSAAMDDITLAVNTVLLQFLFIFSYLTDGFAYAAEALVGKYKGEKNSFLMMRTIRLLFFWGLSIGLSFSFLYLFLGEKMYLLLTDNAKVIASSTPYLFWLSLVPIATFAAFIWDGIYIGATESAPLRNTLLISTFLVFLPSYYIFAPLLDNHGLWLSMMLFMISRGILLTLFAKKSIFNRV